MVCTQGCTQAVLPGPGTPLLPYPALCTTLSYTTLPYTVGAVHTTGTRVYTGRVAQGAVLGSLPQENLVPRVE